MTVDARAAVTSAAFALSASAAVTSAASAFPASTDATSEASALPASAAVVAARSALPASAANTPPEVTGFADTNVGDESDARAACFSARSASTWEAV